MASVSWKFYVTVVLIVSCTSVDGFWWFGHGSKQASEDNYDYLARSYHGETSYTLSCLGEPLAVARAEKSYAAFNSSRYAAFESTASGGCQFAWQSYLSPLSREYLQLIRKHQTQKRKRLLVFNIAAHGWPYWGSLFFWVNYAMTVAYATERSLVFDLDDEYKFVPPGPWAQSWYFYYEKQEPEFPLPYRNCTHPYGAGDIADIFGSDEAVVYNINPITGRNDLKIGGEQSSDPLLTRFRKFFPTHRFLTPSESVTHLKAWRSALAAYTFCPRPWVLRESECRLQRLGLKPHEYIAIHIRRGDKVAAGSTEGRLIPVEEFFIQAGVQRRVAAPFANLSTLYVAFDDQSIVPELEAAARKYNFDLVIDPDEAPLRRGNPLTDPNSTGADLLATHLNDMKNFIAFLHAFTIVGADMSTFFRAARTIRGLDSDTMRSGLSVLHNLAVREWTPL